MTPEQLQLASEDEIMQYLLTCCEDGLLHGRKHVLILGMEEEDGSIAVHMNRKHFADEEIKKVLGGAFRMILDKEENKKFPKSNNN